MSRLQTLAARYGPLFFFTYFAIFFLSLAFFYLAFRSGIQVEAVASQIDVLTKTVGGWLGLAGSSARETTASVGAFAAAYICTKVLQPARIALSVALTPLVVRIWSRKVEGESEDPTEAD